MATQPAPSRSTIKRQASPDAAATTEKFEIPYRPNMNITSLLGEIALNPMTADGAQTTPIAYDSNCLEEICGSCAMLINGKATMACSALVDKLLGPNMAAADLEASRWLRCRSSLWCAILRSTAAFCLRI